jgi:hypothetical protein
MTDGRAMPEPNYRDLRTYSHLVHSGHISSRMRVHVEVDLQDGYQPVTGH